MKKNRPTRDVVKLTLHWDAQCHHVHLRSEPVIMAAKCVEKMSKFRCIPIYSNSKK